MPAGPAFSAKYRTVELRAYRKALLIQRIEQAQYAKHTSHQLRIIGSDDKFTVKTSKTHVMKQVLQL